MVVVDVAADRPAARGALHVYVFDLLGFGASEQRAGQDVSLAGHGARLAALLEHWRLDRPAVVAHDIGGAAILRAHLLHGRDVAALALVDVVAVAPWGSPFYRLVRDHDAVFEQLPAAIHEGVVRAYVGDRAAAPAAARRRGRAHGAVARPGRPVRVLPPDRAGRPARHRAVEPLYGRIAAPTLVVWGSDDPWIPAARGAALAARIPGARLELLPGAGHLVGEDEPDALARLLLAHLG